MGAKSLKDQNKLALLGLIVGNLAIYYGVLQGDRMITGDWTGVANRLGEALPAGLALALVGIINAQLSAEMKARIVFYRWSNPLPGCEAFSRLAAGDPRVDLHSLEDRLGPLPSEPKGQNVLWYKLYKSVETDPAVEQVHREFLFSRDYTCLALMMLVVLGTGAFLQEMSSTARVAYVPLLFAQFLLAGRAARNHGTRFVTTVLAITGASGSTSLPATDHSTGAQ